MRRAAALCLAAASFACGAHRPAVGPALSVASTGPAAFVAAFEAHAWNAEEKLRFRGLIASRGGDHLRAEIAAPSVSEPLIIVAAPGGVLVWLVSERRYFTGEAGAPVLARLAGVPVDAAAISRLLTVEGGEPPDGCTATRRAWIDLAGGGRVAGRLALRCGASGLKIRLGAPGPIPDTPSGDPFSLLPPPDYEAVGVDELVETLRGDHAPRSRALHSEGSSE
jgi:hypothetical protein